MLMLGRRPGQEIILRDHLGNYIGRITIGRIQRGKDGGLPIVRVGLEVPDSIKIARREVDGMDFPQPDRHVGIDTITKAASPRVPPAPRDTRTPTHIRTRRAGGVA